MPPWPDTGTLRGASPKYRALGSDDEDLLERALATDTFHEYRHMRVFQPRLIRRLMHAQIAQTLRDGQGTVLGAWEGEELVGILHAVPVPWETAWFRESASDIRHLVTIGSPAARHAIGAGLLDIYLNRMNDARGYVSHRLDPADAALSRALEARGFRLVDTVMSYLFSCQRLKKVSRAFPPRYAVRLFTPQDLEEVLAVASQTDFRGRFYQDGHFDRARVDAMYRTWVTRCCAGELADEVIVAEGRGRVVGFLTYRRLLELERATGLKISGRGLLSVLPTHQGAAVDLFRVALTRVGRYVDFGQFDARLTNPPMLRLCGAFGMRLAHVRHVFHRWADDAHAGEVRA